MGQGAGWPPASQVIGWIASVVELPWLGTIHGFISQLRGRTGAPVVSRRGYLGRLPLSASIRISMHTSLFYVIIGFTTN